MNGNTLCFRLRSSWLFLVLMICGILSLTGAAAEMTLEYRGRYNCQTGEADHLLCSIALGGNRAIVAGNRGLAVLDLAALPVGGTRDYLFRLTGLNARDLYLTNDANHVLVNLHRGSGGSTGFSVVRISGNTLQQVAVVDEPGVLYEKMCIRNNLLYVTAHRNGIRIFDITTRENPTLVGELEKGFVDAFAIDVQDTTAFVADGAGGLKIVDVSDPTSPFIVAGENLETAAGTSEDVTVRQDRIYVAAGGAGLAVYERQDIYSRTLYQIGGYAESLSWVNGYLAVGTIHGVMICETGEGTSVTPVGSETAHRRGPSGSLRLLNDVASTPDNLVLCANWNFMDVYELTPRDSGSQPDINCSVQRIRFPESGGTRSATITNNGSATLNISAVSSNQPTFSADYAGGSLAPGDAVTFDVHYSGSAQDRGTGVIAVSSNDPDENPLPIQVFGTTSYLDPAETVVDFTLPTLTWNPVNDELEEGVYSLSEHLGKVVWFSVFGTW